MVEKLYISKLNANSITIPHDLVQGGFLEIQIFNERPGYNTILDTLSLDKIE